jgi:hypothetical protein
MRGSNLRRYIGECDRSTGLRRRCNKAAVAVLGMNLALTAALRELTGKRAYERAGTVH